MEGRRAAYHCWGRGEEHARNFIPEQKAPLDSILFGNCMPYLRLTASWRTLIKAVEHDGRAESSRFLT
jgi:hypothetical protein